MGRFSAFTDKELYILKRMGVEGMIAFADRLYTDEEIKTVSVLLDEILSETRTRNAVGGKE